MGDSTSALLYVAHQLNDDVIAGWRHVVDSRGRGNRRPVFVYDNSRLDFDIRDGLRAEDAYLFTYAQLARRFTLRAYDPHRPLDQGNAIFPILAFHRDHPQYSYYWRIEYDVFLDGSWSDLLDHYAENDAHLITTTLARPESRPDWGWWTTLRKPWSVWRSLEPIRAFMPVARLSGRACSKLDRAYARGWAGHDEVAVPTILNTAGLRIEDLGGTGEFTPSGNRELFYTNSPKQRGLAPGTFVCPPQEPSQHQARGKLYHPVKDRLLWKRSATENHDVSCRANE